MRKGFSFPTVLASALATVALGLTLAAPAQAALKAVGPAHPVNKFPIYYQDQSNLRLELCLDWVWDGQIPAASTTPCLLDPRDPTLPFSYPTTADPLSGNWSDETFFYFESPDFKDGPVTVCGTGAPATLNINKRDLIEMALEATYAMEGFEPGQEIVFARYRVRLDGLTPNSDYVIRTPHNPEPGNVFKTDVDGEINTTFDVGITPGVFTGPLVGYLTPNFLTWPNYQTMWADPASGLTPGHIGDPNVSHVVTGGIGGFNKVSITGPAIGLDGGNLPVGCVETDRFMIMGKVATNLGVGVDEATYSLSGGVGKVDVYASTVNDIPQTVSENHDGVTANPLVAGAGANAGKHVSHVDFAGPAPLTVTVRNTTDADPELLKIVKNLTDKVVVTKAVYEAAGPAAGNLTVTAYSSDKDNPLTLTVYDQYGPFDQVGLPRAPLGTVDGGVLNLLQDVPPSKVIVISNRGGRAEMPVVYSDNTFVPNCIRPAAPAAVILAPAVVQ